ncbi:MAG TPA: 5-oxoprolinase subunit PxpA [Anaerolineaceae bacterium]|nr:5-oxoprolinase subunit PxpA [Anaerolineaceae bacterium]HQH85819.1 5-oxoprolinase subunit PxpA [Anaerolineaceae bacterium]
MDINCDMGESFGRYTLGQDAQIMPLVTSVSIACGFHAGDPLVMQGTVRLAVEQAKAIGAHPGYPDLQGFGRREMMLAPAEVEALVLYQIGALAGMLQADGGELRHVKPHGALYNQAAKDPALAAAIARAVRRFDRELILVGLAGSALIEAGVEAGLRTAAEGFPERGYNPDGTLIRRGQPGAQIESPKAAGEQAVQLATAGIQFLSGGEMRQVSVDTLCIHGDAPQALQIARAVNAALSSAGVVIAGLGSEC